MSERDPVALLQEVDRPAAPRAEFADTLRERLLEALAEAAAELPPGRRLPRPRLLLPSRGRRPLLAAAVALAVAGGAVAAVVLSRPERASALDVIRRARHASASIPPFRATYRVDLNPDGRNPDRVVPRGATATVVLSYGGPARLRAQVLAERPLLAGSGGPGSYQVLDGRRLGLFDARRRTFSSPEAPERFPALEFLRWHGTYPDWERVCRNEGSQVLPDARIAGRDARRVRCVDFKGTSWKLWIDRETGLLLKVVGQVGGDDFFLGLGAMTSPGGGFEVQSLRYRPAFRAGTFRVAPPPGVVDYQGRLRAASAHLPSFRAVFSFRRGRRQVYVHELWWQQKKGWRRTVLAAQPEDSTVPGGVGSFLAWSRGRLLAYDAQDQSYSITSRPWLDGNPAFDLLPEEDDRYSTGACPVVGHDRIAGRPAVRRRCRSSEVWVDAATGILLGRRGPGFELRVRSIAYRPAFPPGAFRLVPPAGSRSADRLASDPYFKTRLAPGRTAPDWRAVRLDGRAFRLADLRGTPVLLLIFPDWCSGTDPVCSPLGPLEQAYARVKGRVTILWVDWQGSPAQTRKIVRRSRLTFPVVVDRKGASVRAWSVQGWPYWVLLDARGRVIEARFKPQTVAQLERLVGRAR